MPETRVGLDNFSLFPPFFSYLKQGPSSLIGRVEKPIKVDGDAFRFFGWPRRWPGAGRCVGQVLLFFFQPSFRRRRREVTALSMAVSIFFGPSNVESRTKKKSEKAQHWSAKPLITVGIKMELGEKI